MILHEIAHLREAPFGKLKVAGFLRCGISTVSPNPTLVRVGLNRGLISSGEHNLIICFGIAALVGRTQARAEVAVRPVCARATTEGWPRTAPTMVFGVRGTPTAGETVMPCANQAKHSQIRIEYRGDCGSKPSYDS